MKVYVKYQYPGRKIARVEVPSNYVIHVYQRSFCFSFSEKVPGMRDAEVLRSDIGYCMVTEGLITKEATILSIEIFE